MGLGLVISGVGEVICALGWCDSVEERIDRIVDGLCGSLCGFSQLMFELGEELLDRVQIGRVFRQEEELRPGWADGAADIVALVRAEAGFRCRAQKASPLIGPSKNQGNWDWFCRHPRFVDRRSVAVADVDEGPACAPVDLFQLFSSPTASTVSTVTLLMLLRTLSAES